VTNHFFNHHSVNLHYYQFGNGPKTMLCFHGYGMHGKQFSILEEKFGSEYTFYGLDLFFHKKTKLKNQSLDHIKKPLTKKEFNEIITDFCAHLSIDRFSIMAYSLGTHYASVVTELKAENIDKVFMFAPSFLRVFYVFKLLANNKIANYSFYKLFMNKKAIISTLKALNKVRLIDNKLYEILHAEMSVPEMRFSLYANVTFLRHLETKPKEFIEILNKYDTKIYFIFGKRDPIYHSKLADKIIPKLKNASKLVIDEDHDMINNKLPDKIHQFIYDN
jgi:pimeloyl-ACP methyl ester carboxylesterase